MFNFVQCEANETIQITLCSFLMNFYCRFNDNDHDSEHNALYWIDNIDDKWLKLNKMNEKNNNCFRFPD